MANALFYTLRWAILSPAVFSRFERQLSATAFTDDQPLVAFFASSNVSFAFAKITHLSIYLSSRAGASQARLAHQKGSNTMQTLLNKVAGFVAALGASALAFAITLA
jgi:hypothetical protein